MTQNGRLILRLAVLGLVAVILAVAQSMLRKRHPMRWARRNAHEVIDPLEEAAVETLGLGASGHEPTDVAADAAFTALGVVDVLRHRHQVQ
jgi:hypothetical protein